MRRDQRLRLGYSGLFGQIATCLRLKKTPWPSVIEKMLSDWSFEQLFLERGGTVTYALEYLVTTSEDIERAYATAENELKFLNDSDFKSLPRCINDHNYKVVREKLL